MKDKVDQNLKQYGGRREGDVYQDLCAIDCALDLLLKNVKFSLTPEDKNFKKLDDFTIETDSEVMIYQVKHSSSGSESSDVYECSSLWIDEGSAFGEFPKDYEKAKALYPEKDVKAVFVSNRARGSSLEKVVDPHGCFRENFILDTIPKKNNNKGEIHELRINLYQACGGESYGEDKFQEFLKSFLFKLNRPSIDSLRNNIKSNLEKLKCSQSKDSVLDYIEKLIRDHSIRQKGSITSGKFLEYIDPFDLFSGNANDLKELVEKNEKILGLGQPLRDVFVSPKFNFCSFNDKDIEAEEPKNDQVNLISALKKHVIESDLPIILHSPPGYGKTSCLYDLVSDSDKNSLACSGFSILYYSIKELDLMLKTVERVLTDTQKRLIFPLFFDNKKTILMLDGLDENGDSDDKLVIAFIRKIATFSQEINSRPNSKISVIITSRTNFIYNIDLLFKHVRVEIKGFGKEEVDNWLKKHERLTDQAINYIFFEKLLKHAQKGLTQRRVDCSPIFLSLIVRFEKDESHDEYFINKAKLFGKWFDEIVYEKHKGEKINRKFDILDYKKIIKAIAITIQSLGGEVASYENIMESIEKNNDAVFKLLKESKDDRGTKRSLLSHFDFDISDKKNISFSLKIFREFLVAKSIMDTISKLSSGIDPKNLKNECDNRVDSMYFLLSHIGLEDEAWNFVKDMFSSHKLNHDLLINFFVTFFRNVFIEKKYICRPGCDHNKKTLSCEANMITSILHLLSYLHKSKSGGAKIELFEEDSIKSEPFTRLINFVNSVESDSFYKSEIHLGCISLANHRLVNINFHKADLSTADLSNADLGNAELSNADLSRVNLSFSNLHQAKLDEAKLVHANLEGIKNWKSALWEKARVGHDINAPKGFLDWVKEQGAIVDKQ